MASDGEITTILITGANRGLGLGHVRESLRRGRRVLAACREPSSAEDLHDLVREAGSERLEILAYDATQGAQSAEAVKQAVKGRPIDILLNNAGVSGRQSGELQALNPETFLETYRINCLAPLLLADALTNEIAASGRRIIANQSSLLGSLADNMGGAMYAYRASKAGLNMVTRSLAADLRARGVIAVALHPGWVRTRMGGENAPVAIEDSVKGQQDLFDRLSPNDSGGFFDWTGRTLPW